MCDAQNKEKPMTDTPTSRALNAAAWLRNRSIEHITIGLELASENAPPSEIDAMYMKARNCLDAAASFEWNFDNDY
jgi:hypothetical protein